LPRCVATVSEIVGLAVSVNRRLLQKAIEVGYCLLLFSIYVNFRLSFFRMKNKQAYRWGAPRLSGIFCVSRL
jgi:hypothetical protein